MSRERRWIDIRRELVAGIHYEIPYGVTPGLEVFNDELPGFPLAIADFQCEITDRTAQFEMRSFEQQAVTLQYRKQSLDRIVGAGERRFQYVRHQH